MRRRIRSFFRFLLILLVAMLILFLMLRSRYRDVIRELAETQVKNTTSDLTNDAIAKQIAAKETTIMPLMIAGVFYYIFNLIVAVVMEKIEKAFAYYK